MALAPGRHHSAQDRSRGAPETIPTTASRRSGRYRPSRSLAFGRSAAAASVTTADREGVGAALSVAPGRSSKPANHLGAAAPS